MNYWLGLDKLFFSLLRLLLRWMTRAATVPEALADLGLDPDQPVMFVLRESSLADLLVVEQEARRLGLHSPLHSLSLGNDQIRRGYFYMYRRIRSVGRERTAADSRRLDEVLALLGKHPDKDVQLLPVSVLWGRRPDKENSIWRIIFADNWSPPGFIKKFFMVALQGRQLYIQFSQPMSLRQLINEGADDERVSRKALRILRVHFRRQQEAAIGPDLSHRRTLVNSLVDSQQVRAAIAAKAAADNIPAEKLQAKARNYALEIASDYSHTVIRFLELLLNWVWNRLYSGIRLYNLDKLRAVAQDYEVVYVPCHRSHIDYLLLSFVVYRNNLVPPHIAAGINLNMPVVGTILRRGGAFFMRRSFKDNKLYAAVFDEYMHTMLSRGFSVEYFVEGGRSRSGRMLKPKTGMLSMTLKSYLRDSNRPIAFVPVYVGYEKVLEARSYIGEMHGRRKRKESLYGLITSSITYLRSRFGQVHVNFGDPIDLNKFLDEQAPGWRDNRGQPDTPPEWFRGAVNRLGDEIVTRINNAAVANPINLLSLALLASPKHTMDEVQLRQQLALYLKLLQDAPYGDAVGLAERDPQAIIEYGIENEFVQRVKHPLGDLVTMETLTALQVTYVRNNSLHLFILPGLISALFRNARRISLDELHHLVHLMYPFFRTEYFLRWHTDAELDDAVDGIIKVMVDAELVSRDGDCLMGAGLHTPASDVLDHLGQIVLQALERFSLTIRLLVQRGNGSLTIAQLEELAHQTAQRLSLLYEFNSPEFFDRNVLKNFISQLQHYKLVTVADDDTLQIDPELEVLDQEARRILTPEISQAIERITRLPVAQLDAPANTDPV